MSIINKKSFIVAYLLILLLLITSCQENPGKILSSLIELNDDLDNIKLTYATNQSSEEIKSPRATRELKYSVAYLGDRKKAIIETKVTNYDITQTYVSGFYSYDGKNLVCDENFGVEVACYTVNTSSNIDYLGKNVFQDLEKGLKILRGIDYEYKGTALINGRKCELFDFKITNFSMIEHRFRFLLADYGRPLDFYEYERNIDKYNISHTLCLDTKEGYPVRESLNVDRFSPLLGKYLKVIKIDKNLIKVEKNLIEKEFDIPIKFYIRRTLCSPYKIKITVDSFIDGKAKPSLVLYKDFSKTGQLGIAENEPQEFVFGNTLQLLFDRPIKDIDQQAILTASGSLYFDLCIDNDCKSSSCYYSTSCYTYYDDEEFCKSLDNCIWNQTCMPVPFSCSDFDEKEEKCKIHSDKCIWEAPDCKDSPINKIKDIFQRFAEIAKSNK